MEVFHPVTFIAVPIGVSCASVLYVANLSAFAIILNVNSISYPYVSMRFISCALTELLLCISCKNHPCDPLSLIKGRTMDPTICVECIETENE